MAELDDKRDPQLEEIVAYLDGELPAADCARVERRLASDPTFRRQVSRIERAWAALDELPQTRVDDKFNRTTMEMVVDFAKKDTAATDAPQKTVAPPRLKRRNWSTVLAAVAAAAIGFLICHVAWQSPNRMLIQDLPVIAAADSLAAVHDIDELRTIHERLGAELASATAGTAPDEFSAKELAWLATSGFDERREIVEALSDDDKLALRGKFNRFRELPPEEQQSLRELEAEIAKSPNADELRKTMVTLRQWIAGLPPQDQEALRGMSADQRLTTIAEWMGPREIASALSLSDEELRTFAHAVEQPFKEARRELERVMREYRGRGRGDRGDRGGFGPGGPGGEPRMAAALLATRGLAGDGKLLKAVVDAIPERSKETFEKLEPMPKLLWVITWMRQASAVEGQVTDAELERFFAEELSEDEQLELVGLPAGDLHAELVKRYVGEPDLGFGRPRLDGRGRGPRARGWNDGEGRGPGPPPRDGGFGPPGFERGGRGRGGPPPGPGGFGDDGPGFGPPPDGGPPRGFGGPRDHFDDRDHGPDDRPPEGPPPRD